MDAVDEMSDKLNVAEHVIKLVSGCPNCPSCKSIANQYLENQRYFKDGNEITNITNINIQQKVK